MPEQSPPIPLEAALEHASTSHKAMEDGGAPVIMPDDLAVDVSRHGGCFVHPTLGPYTVVDPFWRSRQGDTVVRQGDIMRLWGLIRPETRPSGPNLVGQEIEAFTIDPYTAEPIDMRGAKGHPELFKSINEKATQPHNNLHTVAMRFYEAACELREDAKNAGGLCLPDSAIGHRPMSAADINDDPYVARMVAFLGGPEKIARYNGTSVQRTFERTHGFAAGVLATNLYSVTGAPMEAGLTSASAFADGTALPPYAQLYGDKEPDGYRSTRLFGRFTGVSEAGPFRTALPHDIPAFLGLVHYRMYADRIPNGGRAGGQQADMRERVDHGPMGAHETCGAETDGLHLESNMALTALTRAKLYILERAFASGEIEDLAKRYPRTVRATLHSADFVVARRTSTTMAQQLPRGKWFAQALDGSICNPTQLWLEGLSMILNTQDTLPVPYHLSRQATHWIMRRAARPTLGNIVLDDDGYVDMQSFYQGAPGVLTDYQRALYHQLLDTGRYADPAAAVAHVQRKTAQAWDTYMRTFNPETALAFTANQEQGI